MIIKKGIPVSQGYASGKAIVIDQKISISNLKITDLDSEINKLDLAISKVKENILKIQANALKNIGKESYQIFEAHLQILEDPMILDEVKILINQEFNNALYAIDIVSSKYISMFTQMEDEYMKQRASDIFDVFHQVKLVLAGKSLINLMTVDYDSILISYDVTPSETAQINQYIKAFVAELGGITSHAAIMAKTLELPAILGISNVLDGIKDGDLILVDGFEGTIYVNPDSKTLKDFEIKKENAKLQKNAYLSFINKPSITKDNHEVKLFSNIGNAKDLDRVFKNDAQGIGLFRTEFLYMENSHWPTEEEQFQVYKKVLESLKTKPVIFRTLDIGGDKKLSYYQFEKEENPFLGFRAIRFCLANLDIFKTQLFALLRASIYGNLKIMFPMIATIEEIKKVKEVFNSCQKELDKKNIKYNKNIKLGMMIEIPSAAILIDKFCKYLDFFSIGTNDLIQYSMAADRMNDKISYLYQPLSPAILIFIKQIIEIAHKYNKIVGVCGEMAGDLKVVPFLVGMNLDDFSMTASSILKVRSLINEFTYEDAKKLVKKALTFDTQEEVLKELKDFFKKHNINLLEKI